jgi:hypothetical protein
MDKTNLDRNDIFNIPDSVLPMPVFSDNMTSFFSCAIKAHEDGYYNHFMWLIGQNTFASQDWIFTMDSVGDYLDRCRLKFWYCHSWSESDRRKIKNSIIDDLGRPWWQRLFDPIAIIGQAIECPWIQTPGMDICSDKGKYLKIADPKYNLNRPSPADINKWFIANSIDHGGNYEVYGRYTPD